MRNILTASLLIVLLASTISIAQPTFTKNTDVSLGINQIGGAKEGGAVWADFDNDDDLDLVVNTSADSRLYQNDGGSPPSFTDITATYAAGFLTNVCGRSAIWGDLNNDGYIDFIRNAAYRLEIYINRGIIGGYTDYSFGVDDPTGTGGDEQVPNMVFDDPARLALLEKMNMEGVGLMDYNNDGWLDIIFDNDRYGIDILQNNLNGKTGIKNTLFADGVITGGLVNTAEKATSNTFFTQVTKNSNGHLGLGANAESSPGADDGSGDYIATSDFNNDGFMDILARKSDESDYDSNYDGTLDATTTGYTNDLWKNNGDSTFSLVTSFSGNDASNGNKGGAIFCDFDSDGDFDIFWTDAGTNQIWLQTGLNSGNFVASNTRIDGIGQPDLSSISISGTIDIDGCACGDVDNDGDTDLFLGNDGRSGDGRATGSFLFINNTSSTNDIETLSFSYTNINALVNAEGVNLVDYDNDGDADIYINVNDDYTPSTTNQLWVNDYCQVYTCNFFKVVTQDCINGTLLTRPVVGATMILKDDGGTIVNAAQDMNSAMGHGAQNPAVLNFYTPVPSATYTLDITFPAKIIAPSTTPTVETYSYDFVPNDLVANTLILTSLNASDGSTCDFSPLPIELLYFKGTIQDKTVILRWVTASEINNDFFTIEKSNDGRMFYEIGIVQGAGNSNLQNNYLLEDNNPLSGLSYYRLKQTDYDGAYVYSKIIVIQYEHYDFDFSIYPNPVEELLKLQWRGILTGTGEILLYDLNGILIRKESFEIGIGQNIHEWNNLGSLLPGIYIAEFTLGELKFGSYKIIKQ